MDRQLKYYIVSRNKDILTILSRINKIASSDCSVLLIGETGVGKEMFAEYIHHKSDRNHNNLIKVSLSTLPSDLFESELFGHDRGAFTGSVHEKKGLFELANHGTIFLDDIDDFPLHLQTKLLRVLESGEIIRIGGEHAIPLDIRLITASKLDLSDLVAQGKFRMDLFYRINVFPITIPPLRERIDDIPVLIDHFIKLYEPSSKLQVHKDALKVLEKYSWPGNVRELRNVIQRIILFEQNEIGLESLPLEIKGNKKLNFFHNSCSECFEKNNMSFSQIVNCVEMRLLDAALKKTNGNKSKAAKLLDLSLSTFCDKLKKYDLHSFSNEI